MTKETWKPIEGYAGLYEVSDLGRVRSVDRVVLKSGFRKRIKGKVLKGYISNSGYPCVDLYRDSQRAKVLVHRLVAQAFVHNPDQMPIVNHKDENPLNPRADNLEWCSYSHNNTYGKMKSVSRNKKPVNQLLDGVLVARHESQISAANSVGAKTSSCISNACITGKKAYGYNWTFA